MAIILNINTAFKTASVILSNGEISIREEQHYEQKDHAAFLEPSIKKIFTESSVSLNSIDAVAVVNGPGSYTGLRVGLSSAKALCYALNKPLILLNTLDIMAYALKLQSGINNKNTLFSPLIDARRMEVFTALYNYDLQLINTYSAKVLDENFLKNERETACIIAGGDGSLKLEKILNNKEIHYINPLSLSQPLITLANQAAFKKHFSSVAYSEPFYLKPVYFKNNSHN